MTDSFTLIFVGLIAAIAAFLRLKGSSKKERKSPRPPKNKVADVARSISDKEAQKDLEAIKRDLEGGSPADDLASRGNTRRRK
mgnify:FL=1